MQYDCAQAADIDPGNLVRERDHVVVDRFQRGADFRRHPLGFLVVRKQTGEQKSDDEDRARDDAREQRVEGQEFEPESVDRNLDQDQEGDDDDDVEEQAEPPSKVHAERLVLGYDVEMPLNRMRRMPRTM